VNHDLQDESPLETLQRSLVEELWGGSNHSYTKDIAFIRRLTEHPVYYVREYGPELDNRIDRQLTYFFEVRFNQDMDNIYFVLDDEVAESQWIDVDAYAEWMQRISASGNYEEMCHQTLLEMNQLTLGHLLEKR
jgi:tRNA A37 N6-isopentenylltransferase MiaA